MDDPLDGPAAGTVEGCQAANGPVERPVCSAAAGQPRLCIAVCIEARLQRTRGRNAFGPPATDFAEHLAFSKHTVGDPAQANAATIRTDRGVSGAQRPGRPVGASRRPVARHCQVESRFCHAARRPIADSRQDPRPTDDKDTDDKNTDAGDTNDKDTDAGDTNDKDTDA
ncbi:MAG: hypothetical protein JXB62_11865, partial [Pirellulales bacterium]|nr:hypothetical protein [Pirellulales bacterium]